MLLKKNNLQALSLAIFILLVMAACQSPPTPTTAPTDTSSSESTNSGNETETETSAEGGYPIAPDQSAAATDPGYPVPTVSGLLQELPDSPELSAPEEGFATIGGALVDPEDGGYIPVRPQSLTLGEIVTDNEGRPVFLRSQDNGPQAQLLNAGVFLFNGVEPGRYGLVIDIGIGTFPILDESDNILLFDVEAGQALDLGVLTFELE